MNDDFLRKSNNLNEQISDLFITMPRQFGRTKTLQFALYYDMCYIYGKELVDRILEEQDCSIDDIGNYITKTDDDYFYYDHYKNATIETLNTHSSTDQQITSLKSQLKHCKNYLERQNIERKLNRLYKERR